MVSWEVFQIREKKGFTGDEQYIFSWEKDTIFHSNVLMDCLENGGFTADCREYIRTHCTGIPTDPSLKQGERVREVARSCFFHMFLIRNKVTWGSGDAESTTSCPPA